MSTGKKWEGRAITAFSELKVEMPSHVWDYMMGWCKAAQSEVSGMFLVEYDEAAQVLRVPNIFLPKQECDSASTEIDDDSLAGLQMKLHQDKINLKSLRGWWHTHYNFNVFWSGTDTGTIDKLMAGNDWFVSIVVNQAGDFKARLDIAKPFPIVIDDMDIEVTGVTEDLSKYKKDIEAQVTKKVYAPTHGYHPAMYEYANGYGNTRWDPKFSRWTAGIGYHDDEGNTPSGARYILPEKKKSETKGKYEGKWWEKWDPETWHGYKADKAVDKGGEGAKLIQGSRQSDADFAAELAAEEAIEAAYHKEVAALCGGNDPMDDPMMIRLDGGIDSGGEG